MKEELEMSIFSDATEFELNLGPDVPEQEAEQDEELDTPEQEDIQVNPENNLNEDEDPEEVVEDEDQSEEGEKPDNVTSPNNLYSSFASVLNEQGLLPSLDLQKNKIENVEDLTTVFKSEIDNQVKSYIVSKLGEEGYDALEKGVSLSEYQEYNKNVNTLSSLNEDSLAEDIELSKRLILQDYISQGMDEKRAMRLLKKSIDLGEDVVLEDAKESLESLKILENKRLELLKESNLQREQAQRANQEKIDNDLKNAIYNSEEFIKGIKLNKNIQDKVYKSITQIVGQNENGIMENKLMKERRENPIEFDTKLYYLYEITNGFKDFSKIVNITESKATKNLEQSLRTTKFETSGRPDFLDDPESYNGVGSELVL